MSRFSSGRASSGRQAESEKMSDREKSFTRENTSRKRLARHKGSLGSTLAREKSLQPRRTRPLPFAPTRLDRITVKPSRGEMERSSEHEVNVKRRARQVSVVRRLHRSPKTNTTDKQPMQLPTKNQKIKGDKDREEKRRQEIAKILSLEDPKEQVQRFLRFLNVTIAENSQSKQQLRDNYEEVEMDIDSGDEVTDGFDIYGLPSSLQPLQLMGADAAEFQCTMDLLQGVRQWQIPYPLMDSYSGMISFPTILPSASRNPPISSMPLQVLPPVTPAQPPLPEDLPQPPPPPPPDSEGLKDSADWMNSYSSSVGFANKIDTRATFMKDEIKYQSDQVPCRHTVAPLDADGFEEPPSQKGSSPGLAEDLLKPEAKFGADDEEEIELRKQLLEDLIKRKGQAENKKSESGGSSPATFDAQSPHHTLPTRPRDVPRKVHKAYLLPMHKPVVVPLCDSSSEEEDSEKDCALQSVPGNKSDITDFDIDRFLKLQRKTVEEQKIGSLIKDQDAKSATTLPGKQIRLQHLKQKETDLAKLRHLIIEDQDVLTKGRKIVAEQKKAENVVVQLQQQLMAAQKLVLSKRPLVLRAKMQIQEAHVRLLKNQEMYRRVEEKTLSLGQQLLGADYRPQMAIPLVRSKRKVEVTGKHQVISITVLGKDTKKRKLEDKLGKTNEKENIVTSTTVAASCSPDKRTAEKARLQKLAKEYEEKIRHLKMLQMQRKQSGLASGTSNTKHQKPLTKQVTDSVTSGDSRSTRLPSLESIKLEPVESDTVVHKLRRRSLLDISQSPKPNLLLKEHKSAKKPEVASDANTQSPVGKKKLGTAKFKMPFGFQLQNLCKIQKEKVTKILSSQSYSSPEVFSNLSPHCDPIPELKIISLQEQKRQEKGDPAGLAFTSPLLYFKAYRFSPYYRTKENLTIPSVSYSNKLNPNRILCRYELQGICNDQQCPWQHARDYRFSEKELLQDLSHTVPSLQVSQMEMNRPALPRKLILTSKVCWPSIRKNDL
ncbi:zinc finger C3H1 domain-containing protein-like isoform X2 [Pomacea canaliculata]|uniref:zinc finger C3H1 domain-containing protein-like isoform X2 n=1 Tax=Pomacea canaliculata TaxID=400727 RepID=UPI000D7336BD|nr:zinc finger C3H1 domain-containing protein-like isoform X2 [Pomacea canaliculata]